MARIDPPLGYTSWNVYLEEQADLSPDQSIEARRLIKRNIKLGQIATVDRRAGGDTLAIRYRPFNFYSSPGTFSPVIAHPWLIDHVLDSDADLLQENGYLILQENGSTILVSYGNVPLELDLMNGNKNIDLMVDTVVPTDLQT